MTTEIFVLFRDMTFEMTENRNLKNYKIMNYQPCNWVLSEYTKSLQIWFPKDAFFMICQKFEAPEVRYTPVIDLNAGFTISPR